MRSDSGNSSFGSKIAKDLVIALGCLPNQEEVLCRCPICGDSATDPNKKRLAVNIIKGKYLTFNCGARGESSDIATLLLNLNILLTQEYSDPNQVKPQKEIEFKPISINITKLPDLIQEKVRKDLEPRMVLTPHELDKLHYGLSGSRPKKWIARVFIQVDGVYFGKSIDGSKPKYITQPNFRLNKHGYINESQIRNDNQYKILTEGLLDLLSLPKNIAVMSPGTAGLYNPLFSRLAQNYKIISVPDSDIAGVNAFLQVINKGLLPGDDGCTKFCFVYWITKNKDNDINDLLIHIGGNKRSVYDLLIDNALPLSSTLQRLKKDFNIIKQNGKLILSDTKGHNNGAKRPIERKDHRIRRNSDSKKRRVRRFNEPISWF